MWPKVSGFSHEVDEKSTVLVAEGCSPAVLFALAVCLTVPNTWSINLTTDLLAWCICTKEALAGHNIRKHSCDVVDCSVIGIT